MSGTTHDGVPNADGGPLLPAASPSRRTGVHWRAVAVYYLLAVAGCGLAALVLVLIGATMGGGLTGIVAGAAAMLAPLIAGVVVERFVLRRPTLLSRGWASFTAAKLRTIGRIAGRGAVGYAAVVAGVFATAGLASGRVPGAGTWVTQAQFDQILSAAQPALAGQSVPIGLVVGSTLVQALVAGFTINGLFAFGEEYGWRGVLADQLAPLGMVRANLLTGVLWGLWHAPLIALGHNYGGQWAVGIWLFVLITTPLSFILWWARQRSGSVVTSAVIHGAFNGFAGLLSLLLVGAEVLIAVPVGVLAGVGLSVVAGILWLVPGLRPRSRDAAAGTGLTPPRAVPPHGRPPRTEPKPAED